MSDNSACVLSFGFSHHGYFFFFFNSVALNPQIVQSVRRQSNKRSKLYKFRQLWLIQSSDYQSVYESVEEEFEIEIQLGGFRNEMEHFWEKYHLRLSKVTLLGFLFCSSLILMWHCYLTEKTHGLMPPCGLLPK